MNHIKEPHQLVSSADVIDLTSAFETSDERAYAAGLIDDEAHEELLTRHKFHKDKATKNLRKFNRKTLVN